ncbi:MAG: hypothetical protein U0Q16_13890 [Bryobacteraceae bacterium]
MKARPEVKLPEKLKNLPLRFEANAGQWDPAVRFRAKSGAMTIWLTDQGPKFVLTAGKVGDPLDPNRELPKSTVVGMRLKNSRPAKSIEGMDRLEGYSNFYLSPDPAQWRTNVPNYGKVTAKDVYPGIDTVYYGKGRRMEYDFVVAPGADPSKIELAYDGVDSMRLNEKGDLLLATSLGEIRQLKPRVYQEIGGRQVELAGNYKLAAGGALAFQLSEYDPSKPVVIDPLIDFSTYFGGALSDALYGVGGDASGIYIAGFSFGGDLPVLGGTGTSGGVDAFVTKFNSTGTGLLFSTYFGGTGTDQVFAMVLDDQGSTYIGGISGSPALPGTSSGFQPNQGGGTDDAWVAKFNTNGALMWSSFYGGTGIEAVGALALDASRNVYAVGQTTSTSLDMTGGFQTTHRGGQSEGFIIKIAAAGKPLLYNSYLGGAQGDFPQAVAVDPLGQAIVGGYTRSTDFTLQAPLQSSNGSPGGTGFVTKVSANGGSLVYSTFLGGSGLTNLDIVTAVKTDAFGAAYVCGYTTSPNFPITTGVYDSTHNGFDDVFVSKISPSGNALNYSTFVGGSGNDDAWAMAVDGSANVYVAGQTFSSNFPVVGQTQGFAGGGDGFVFILNSLGTAVTWSTYLGGSLDDIVRSVALDNQGRILAGGITRTPFPVQNGYDSSANGSFDTFLVRYSATGGGGGGPTIIAPTPGQVIGTTGVTFQWAAVGGAAGYGLRINQGAATVFQGTLSGAGSTSTLISLQNGTYTFSVNSCTDAALTVCGPFSSVTFSVSLPTPGGAPTITAPAQGAVLTTSIQTLTWTSVASATRYEVLITNTGTSQVDLSIGVPVTNTVYQMSSGNYRMEVRACIEACGAYSNPVTFTVQLPPVPTQKPNPPTCQVIGGNQLQCSWSAITNADSYILQVVQPTAGPGGGALTVASSNDSALSVTIPVPAGAAFVFLQGCNGDGCGPNSDALAINPAGPNPSSPVLGTPIPRTKVVGPGVAFSWNRVAGDNGSNVIYRLFAQDFSRSATAADVLTTSNFFALQFKAGGNRYDALVVSNPGASQVVGPATPFNVKGSDPVSPTLVIPRHQTNEVNSTVPQGNVTLGWTPLTGATLYEYFIAIPGGAGLANGVTPGLLVQIPISVPSGSTVSGIVRACPAGQSCTFGSNAGWGPWSNTAGGTGVTNFKVQ